MGLKFEKYRLGGYGENLTVELDEQEQLIAELKDILQKGGGSGGGSGSGIVDVTELPTENIDENAVYRITENKNNPPMVYLCHPQLGTITMGQLLQLEVGEEAAIVDNAIEVDELSEPLMPLTSLGSNGEYIITSYILKSTGAVYVSQDGTLAQTKTIGEFMFGGAEANKGYIDSVGAITESGVYAIRGETYIVYHYWKYDGSAWSEFISMIEVSELPTENIQRNVCYALVNTTDDGETRQYFIYENDWMEYTAPEGEIVIIENGTYDVKGYKFATITMPINTYNIAYGDTAPEDTSKLWIKTSTEPDNLIVTPIYEHTGKREYVTNMPYGSLGIEKDSVSAVSVGSKIYTFGGYSPVGYRNDIYIFDPETKTSTASSTVLPYAMSAMGAAAVGTKIYLFGGAGRSLPNGNGNYSYYGNAIYIYDTEIDAITTSSITIPNPMSSIGAAAVGTKIYLFGGHQYGTNADGTVGTIYNNIIYIYDTETDTITTSSITIPNAMSGIGAVTVGTKIYLFGGSDDGSDKGKAIYIYDTEIDAIITSSTELPVSLSYIGTAAIGTKIYLFGGSIPGEEYRAVDTIYIFDTETYFLAISATKLLNTMLKIGVATVNSNIYLFGGLIYNINSINKTTYEKGIYSYSDVSALETGVVKVHTSPNKNIFNITDNIEVGVEKVYLGNADGYADIVEAALYDGAKWMTI